VAGMTEQFVLKLCSDRTAFEIRPKKPLTLDLLSLKNELVDKTGMKARLCLAAILLLEDDQGRVVSIFPTGRLLLRKFSTQDSAEEIARLIAPLLYSTI